MKRNLIACLKVLILIGILYWLAKSFPAEHWTALRDQPKHWGLLSIALIAVLVANIISFLRWRLLVRSLDVPFSATDAIRFGFLGCLFNLISAGSVGGDLFKAIAAARHAEKKRPEVIGSVIVDRAMGLLGLILVAALSLEFLRQGPISEQLNWIRKGAWLLGVIGIVTLSVVVVAGKKLPLKWLNKFPFIGHALFRMSQAGLIFDGRAKLMVSMMLISMLVHSMLTCSTFLISSALYSQHPSVQEHFLVIPPAMAAGALPLTPGGLGVQEVAIQKLFEQLPDTPENYSGLITAAMYRLMTFVVAGIGAIFYFYASSDVRRIVTVGQKQIAAPE